MFVLENIKAIWKLIYLSIIVIHIYIMAGICLFFFTITSIIVIVIVYTIIIFFYIPRERSFSREQLSIFSECSL